MLSALAWAFAPILVLLALLTALFAAVAALAIWAARAIERRRGAPPPPYGC